MSPLRTTTNTALQRVLKVRLDTGGPGGEAGDFLLLVAEEREQILLAFCGPRVRKEIIGADLSGLPVTL